MPPIHKKGALFSIHQDSPQHASHSHTNSGGIKRSILGPKLSRSLSTAPTGGKENAIPAQISGTKGKKFGVFEDKENPSGSVSLGNETTSKGKGVSGKKSILGEAKVVKSAKVLGERKNDSASLVGQQNSVLSMTSTSKPKLFNGLRKSTVTSLKQSEGSSSNGSKLLGKRSPLQKVLGSSFKLNNPEPPKPSRAALTQEEEEDDEIYSKPVLRKKKTFTSRTTELVGVPTPVLPSTETFGTPLTDLTPVQADASQGFALPAFPTSRASETGLFGGNLFGPGPGSGSGLPGKSALFEKKKGGLFGPVPAGRGKENVPPLGEEEREVTQGNRGGHRMLGSAFDLDRMMAAGPPAATMSQGLGLGIFEVEDDSRTTERIQRSLPSETSRSHIHGLGFGFTPVRPAINDQAPESPILSGRRGHQRGLSSASGINHFLPSSNSFGSNLGDQASGEGSSFEKAKVTPLKSRSRKRTAGGHRRGASSVSLTNHFLPPSTSQGSNLAEVGEEGEVSPMQKAKVTPLKSRRKHVRQKSSLSRGFSFGSSSALGGLGLGLTPVKQPAQGLGLEPLTPVGASKSFSSVYADEELGDMEDAPSVWESASSKRSSNTTSSLGSATKRFWGLDVNHEQHELEEGVSTGSPMRRRRSASPARIGRKAGLFENGHDLMLIEADDELPPSVSIKKFFFSWSALTSICPFFSFTVGLRPGWASSALPHLLVRERRVKANLPDRWV
jgi:hypothetical protein